MRKKRGFTLIEIIISISIISLVSVIFIVGINYANKKKIDKQIEKVSTIFDNALNVYLSEHSEIYENLSDNVEGAVITLDLLKNEGLIKDKIIDPRTNSVYDYKNNYYVLSDAVLLNSGDEIEENGENECNGRVELNVFRSWKDISDKASSGVIYVCPKNNTGYNRENKVLEDRISKLESVIQKFNLGGNNYVIFNVNSDPSKLAYFSENESIKDLWRIVSGSSSGLTTLMYNQNINTNYRNIFANLSDKVELSNGETDFCINGNKIKVKSVKPASLGKYLGYYSQTDISFIQQIYKDNDNNFYKYTKTLGSCYYGFKIDLYYYLSSAAGYKKLDDNSDYNNYYFDTSKSHSGSGLSIKSETDELDYISLFDLKDAKLLTSYESYSSSYKNKYSSCDSSKLGSYDCPYLLKFTNGYYSDGTNS